VSTIVEFWGGPLDGTLLAVPELSMTHEVEQVTIRIQEPWHTHIYPEKLHYDLDPIENRYVWRSG
jgi:hypothetical protein